MQSERKYWPTDDVRRLFDDPSFDVPGQPNYRNRPGRSGLDPIDNQYEYSHIKGRAIRMLLDGKWYTDNSLLVIALIFFAIFSLLDFISLLVTVIAIGFFSPIALLLLVGYFLIVPPLLMRAYRALDSLDDEDEEWEGDEFGE
jgi:hypothetical protein